MAYENKYRLGYRYKGQNKYISGPHFPVTGNVRALPGGVLCWRIGSNSNDKCFAKLVHKGSVHGSNLCLRKNGINYQVAWETENEHQLYDDCGNIVDTGNDVSAAGEDGFYFGGVGVDQTAALHEDILLNSSQPFTIHFKVKGTAQTGSSKIAHLFSFSTDKIKWTPTYSTSAATVLAFGMKNNGDIVFQDHFHSKTFSGSKTDWRDFKITFYPGTYQECSAINMEAYPTTYKIVHNGEEITGSTYFTQVENYCYVLIAASRAVDSTQANSSDIFYGYFKFLSIAQGEVGYSAYRQSAHKFLLHFD
ncbi:MAG: hypothetical protein IKZ53_06325 [Selenomonadaceae bacterium]|nr:hypothetical protein [Selenomonadaceae bacterium]